MSNDDPRRTIARLVVAIMAADGRITKSEMEMAAHLDGLGLGDLSEVVREEIDAATRDPIEPREVCRELPPLSREAAATIVAALAEVALADKVLSRRESQLVFVIARELGLEDGETEQLVRGSLAAHGGRVSLDADAPASGHAPAAESPTDAAPDAGEQDVDAVRRAAAPPPSVPPAAKGQEKEGGERDELAWARDLLGVGPAARRADIDAAYLRLVSFYDPAKVIELGPEFVVLAVRRLSQATTAYQIASAGAA